MSRTSSRGCRKLLRPLAAVAYNYRWSWHPDGEAVFRDLEPARWDRVAGNPVRFLYDLDPAALARVDAGRIRELAAAIAAEQATRPTGETVAYLCAEYGIHESLPIYSGGLGVLAGDTLKEASDRALPFVGVGLLYRRGYHRQRLDASGRQIEYWIESDPERLPMARVTLDGKPLELSVDVYGRPTWFHVWRVDVGRVPLFLIDADVPRERRRSSAGTRRASTRETGQSAWRSTRCSGWAALRVLQALGIDPAVFHLNEGHPALAALALRARAAVERGRLARHWHASASASCSRRTRRYRQATRPTAGGAPRGVPRSAGAARRDEDEVLGSLRTQPGDRDEPVGA